MTSSLTFSNLNADTTETIMSHFLTPVARLINRATRRHLSFCKQFAKICKLHGLVAFEPEHYELDTLENSSPVVPIQSAFRDKEIYPFKFTQTFDEDGNCVIIVRPLVLFEWASQSYGYYHPGVFDNEILFLIDKDMDKFIHDIKKEMYVLKQNPHILPENGIDNNIYFLKPTHAEGLSFVPFHNTRNADVLIKEKIQFVITSTFCKMNFQLKRCNRVCVCF